jgi:hypothetical protein
MSWPLILAIILGHILVIGGCYLTAKSINILLRKPATPAHIFNFRGSIFWGLFVIMGGFCFFSAPILIILLQ